MLPQSPLLNNLFCKCYFCDFGSCFVFLKTKNKYNKYLLLFLLCNCICIALSIRLCAVSYEFGCSSELSIVIKRTMNKRVQTTITVLTHSHHLPQNNLGSQLFIIKMTFKLLIKWVDMRFISRRIRDIHYN